MQVLNVSLVKRFSVLNKMTALRTENIESDPANSETDQKRRTKNFFSFQILKIFLNFVKTIFLVIFPGINTVLIETAEDDVNILPNWKQLPEIPEINVFIEHLSDDLRIN